VLGVRGSRECIPAGNLALAILSVFWCAAVAAADNVGELCCHSLAERWRERVHGAPPEFAIAEANVLG
jgi:hypothetical protein